MASSVEIVIEGRDRLSGPAGNARQALGGLQAAAQQAGSAMGNMSQSGHAAGNAFNSLTAQARQMQSSLAGVTQQALGFIGGMLGVQLVGNAFGMVREALIGFNAQVEQSRIGWGTLLKSQAAGLDMLNQLQRFAATTPFEFPDLERSSKRLMAMGFAAAEVLPVMRAVGDTSSALGAGPEGIMRMVYALGQMKTKGRVMAEEMMQIGEAGAPVWDMLAQHIGKPISEIQEMVSKGRVSAEQFVEAFKKYAEANYPGMMEKQSRTFEGAMSTIRDNARILSSTAMEPLFNRISALILKFSELTQGDLVYWAKDAARQLNELADRLGSIPGVVIQTAAVFGALATAAALSGPVLGAIGVAIGMLLSPVGLVVAAVAALYYAWQTNWNGIQGIAAAAVPVLLQILNVITGLVQEGGKLAQQLGPGLTAAFTSLQNMLGQAIQKIRELANWIGNNLGLVLQISAVALTTWASVIATRGIIAVITYAGHVAALVIELTTLATAHAVESVRAIAGFVASIAKATAHLVLYAVEGLARAITATGRLALILVTQTVPALAAMAVQIITKTLPALILLTVQGFQPMLFVLPRMILLLLAATAGYTVLGVQAAAAAVRVAAAWVVTMLPAVVGAVGAMLLALAPFAAGIAVIAIVAGTLALAWSQNWGDIQGITARVLDFLGQKLTDFLNFLSDLPIIGEAVKWVKGAVTMAQTELPKLASAATSTVETVVGEFKEGFPSVQNILKDFAGSLMSTSAEMPEWAAGIVAGIAPVKAAANDLIADEINEARAALSASMAYEADRVKNEKKNEEARKAAATKAAEEARKEAEKAQREAEQFAREAASKANEIVSRINAAAPIQAVIQALVKFHPAMKTVIAEVEYWGQQIVAVNLALVANRDQVKAAQGELDRMGERLSNLNQQLSEAKSRLADLSAPRLRGMGEIERQIALIETQLKRLQLAELRGVSVQNIASLFPMLERGAEAFMRTLPTSREELNKMLENLRLSKELKFDESLRLIAAAAGETKKEMTFSEAMQGISATKAQINSLTGAIVSQEAAMSSQKKLIESLQKEGEKLNAVLQQMQEKQSDAKEKQGLMNQALEKAYEWLLKERDVFPEVGEKGAEAAEIVDVKAREIITAITLASGDASRITKEDMQKMVLGFETAKAEAVLKIRDLVANLDDISPPIDTAILKAKEFKEVLDKLKDKSITITTTYISEYRSYGGGGGGDNSPPPPAGGNVQEGPPGQFGSEFFVRGMGGTDSQWVAFRATPGERVTVSPPGRASTAQNNLTVQVYVSGSVQAEQDLAATIRRELLKTSLRNGGGLWE